jgi:hypothetical protein
MHKPLKSSFTEIINAVADGRGVAKPRKRSAESEQGIVRSIGTPNAEKEITRP